MIPKIMQEISPDTVMALMNAVYFEGKWQEAFEKEDTYEKTFYHHDSTAVVRINSRCPEQQGTS